MFEDLKWLVELQKVDNIIHQVTGEQRSKETAISRLKQEIEELKLQKVKLIRKQKEASDDRLDYQEDITDHERILEQKQTDLDNDKKTKKEHIKREVKKLQKAVEVFKEKVVDYDSEIDEIDQDIESIDKKVAKLNRKISSEDKKKKLISQDTKKEHDKLLRKKKKIEKAIRKPFLNHYNRIMKIRNGIAITYVTNEGLCNGCRIHIPYQLQQKIKLQDDYNICEGCGRILVDREMLEK